MLDKRMFANTFICNNHTTHKASGELHCTRTEKGSCNLGYEYCFDLKNLPKFGNFQESLVQT